MESLTNNVIEKLSSYKIFNNLFPGIIFCAITGKITRINIATGVLGKICLYTTL